MKWAIVLLSILLTPDCIFAKKGDGNPCKGKKKVLCKKLKELTAKVAELEEKLKGYETNPCSPNPCKNDGSCEKKVAPYKCTCKPGFGGEDCNEPKPCDPNPCKNQGTCKDLGNNKFECECKSGFGGADCSEESNFPGSNIFVGHPEYSKQLAEYLEPVEISGKDWKMCYRASDYGGLKSPEFHTHCGLKGPTVTVIQCESNVFGGYTDQDWVESIGGIWHTSQEAFLFSLSNELNKPFKSAVFDSGHASYSYNGYGPTFGVGADLKIDENGNLKTKFGYSYTLPFGMTRESVQANTILIGLGNTCQDYEVYYQE